MLGFRLPLVSFSRCTQSTLRQSCRLKSTASAKQAASRRLRQQQPSSALFLLAALSLSSIGGYLYYDYWSSRDSAIAPFRFVPCKITNIHPLTPQTSVYTLSCPSGFLEDPPSKNLTAVYLAQPEIQIQRPFTPLQPIRSADDRELQLLVKRYDQLGAEMSQYIHRQRVGDELLVRGPEVTWFIDAAAKHITFIAGGTGITPFIQLVHHLNSLPFDAPRPSLSLLYASSTSDRAFLEGDIKNLLQDYPSPVYTRFLHTRVQVSGQDPFSGTLNRQAVSDLLQTANAHQHPILVCGPNGLVKDVSGPPANNPNRRSPVGGMLKDLGVPSEQVYRL